MPETNPDLSLQFSTAAIVEINRLCRQWGYPSIQVRVGVAAGGCQGQRYTLGFRPEDVAPDDRLSAWENVQVAIEPRAVPFLQGCTLDYAEDLMGGNFRFHHPPVALCACGLSFSVPVL
jgi:iron-sulfur cluster assembly protein